MISRLVDGMAAETVERLDGRPLLGLEPPAPLPETVLLELGAEELVDLDELPENADDR